jgi:hypothetical protein
LFGDAGEVIDLLFATALVCLLRNVLPAYRRKWIWGFGIGGRAMLACWQASVGDAALKHLFKPTW